MQKKWLHLTVEQWKQSVAEHGVQAGIEAALENIAELNPQLNAFILVLADQALERACYLETLPTHERGPLHGVPVAIKDENDVAGTVTSFGTACNETPRRSNSLTVDRLLAAGAVIIGKTAMPAFGAFPFTESKAFGITRSPHDPAKTPGGSSGGSAVAVAAGLVPLALGGDGGGSVRIPAERCGLVGYKPARGMVPTAPYDHLWHDLGTAGPLAGAVDDAELMYGVLADQKPSHGERHPDDAPLFKRPLRVAVNLKPANPLVKLHPDHRRAVWKAAQKLREQGHTVEYVSFTHPDPTLAFVVQFFAGLNSEIDALEKPEKLEQLHRSTRKLGSWARGPVLDWAKARGESISQKLEHCYFEENFDLLLTPHHS